MLFLGLGTGLGTALVVDGVAESRELSHFPYRKGTLEDYVGARGMKRFGKKKWRKEVGKIVAELVRRIRIDDVVLGGGQVKKLKKLPQGCREGSNANAFIGGFRLWEESPTATAAKPRLLKLQPRRKEGSGETRSAGRRARCSRASGWHAPHFADNCGTYCGYAPSPDGIPAGPAGCSETE